MSEKSRSSKSGLYLSAEMEKLSRYPLAFEYHAKVEFCPLYLL